MSIPVFKPSIKRRDMDAVLTCMVRDSIGPGEQGKVLVKEVKSYLGLQGGFALREYRRAIELAIVSIGLEEGDRVLLSPLSPRVYIDVLEEYSLVPRFVDVDPESACLDPGKAGPLFPEDPKAIIIHYPLGIIPDMEEISSLGLPIIEDISTALGGGVGDMKAGSWGQYVVAAFEEDGIITTGGGAIVFASGKRELRALKDHGEYLPQSSFMSDMNAALGVVQIGNIENFIRQREEIADIFSKSLLKSKHRGLLQRGEGKRIFYSFPVLLGSGLKDAARYARKKNIETMLGFTDTAVELLDGNICPNARALALRCLLFPLYPMMGKRNAELISKVLSTLP
ncbi:MAG: DegT/DnrJ/EryC1/StrS aminotransferase family protein [Spirochaetales bacterium]|nr:DegT/DnrJ/EryC1/StrS aminotransferase family protein [Spirochaetales bacterium]